MGYPYTDKFEALKAIAEECHETSKSKGWWNAEDEDGKMLVPERLQTLKERLRTIPTKIALIHSEASEALEEYREGNLKTLFRGSVQLSSGTQVRDYASPHGMDDHPPRKPVGFPSELADILIRTLEFAVALDIDIAEEVRLKMAYNQTRPHRHGGKAC